MVKTKSERVHFRADDPKADGRSFREATWCVETRECGEGENKKTERVVRCSISSETPYPRYMKDPESGEYVKCLEVLGHAAGEIDDSRMRDGLVIQDTHWGEQVGIMDAPEVKDGKIGGVIRFSHSQKGRDFEADALDGIKKNMSVGYMVKEYKRDGVDKATGLPIFRVTKWCPYEASFVNVPADTNVGVGRVAAPETKTPAALPAVENKGVSIMDKPSEAGYSAEQKQKVRELASAAHVSGEEVAEILLSGRAFEEVREELLNRREKYLAELAKKPAKPAEAARAEVLDEAAKKEVHKRYSFANVLRFLTDKADGITPTVDVGFEREISQEMAQKTGRAVQGILLPDCVRSTDGQETLGRPAHGVTEGIGGTGSNTVATVLMAGSFIEALVDTLVLRERCGIEVISGLVGNVAIPKGDKLTAGWIGEGQNAPKKNPTFGQVTMTPHTLGAYTDITRQLLLQSSINVQGKVMEWLMYAAAKCLETAGFQGTGQDAQPTGVITQIAAGLSKAWANAPTFDKIVELIALCKNNNSYKPSMRFVGDTNVWAKLVTTRDYEKIEKGTDGVAVAGGRDRLLDWQTDKVIGREFVESHCVPAKTLLFGDFSQLTLGLWSGTDIIVDPYANSTNGGLRVVALQDADFAVKTPEAFVKATGVHA